MTPYFLNANVIPPGSPATDSMAFFTAVATNSGNSYITYAMLKMIGKNTDYLNRDTAHQNLADAPLGAQEIERINTQYTHVFFTLQDHIRPDAEERFYRHACDALECLKLPVIAYSLGANGHVKALSPLQRRFLGLLSEKCAVIGIRGAYTASILDGLGIRNYKITGCPSYFEQGPDRHLARRGWDDTLAVGATGFYYHPDKERLRYFLQSEIIPAKIVHFPDAIEAGDYGAAGELASRPYRQSLASAIGRNAAMLYADMDLWRADIAAHVNFVIGTRLHGAIMALSAGRPAIVTNNDARAAETCAFLGIPHYPGGIGLPKELRAIYDMIDIESINARYGRLYDNFTGWMRDNALPPPVISGTAPRPVTLPLNTPAIRDERLDAMLRYVKTHRVGNRGLLKRLWFRFRPQTGMMVKLQALCGK